METVAEEVGIEIRHRLAGGAVDDHRVKQVILFHQSSQAVRIKRLFGFAQRAFPVAQVDAVHVGQQRARVGDAADAQIDMLLFQPRLLAIELIQQRAADAADAYYKDFNHLIGGEQHLVHHAHAGGGVIVAHHHRDRAL